ncbi:MAG: hypothetical protein Q9216_001845 [Gyalolechia sp. 2 TL-2023]
MASALTANQYRGQQPVFAQAPHHPPSPPIDDFHTKCTLPSIQSLIGVMAESPSTDAGQQQSERQHSLPSPSNQPSTQHADNHPQAYGQPPVSNPQALPPTPPLRSYVGFDASHQSPSATSSRSSAAPVGPYYGSAKMSSTTDPQLERQPPPPATHPGQGPMAPASESPYHTSPYPPSPTIATTYAYPPPAHAATAPPPVYYQRPLPTNFPPLPSAPASVPMDPAMTSSRQEHSPAEQSGSPWQHQHQHHHYISPSSSAALSGQPQDRYVIGMECREGEKLSGQRLDPSMGEGAGSSTRPGAPVSRWEKPPGGLFGICIEYEKKDTTDNLETDNSIILTIKVNANAVIPFSPVFKDEDVECYAEWSATFRSFRSHGIPISPASTTVPSSLAWEIIKASLGRESKGSPLLTLLPALCELQRLRKAHTTTDKLRPRARWQLSKLGSTRYPQKHISHAPCCKG